MTKEETEYCKQLEKRSYWTADEELLVKFYQQTKELTEEVSKLENTLRVQGNVILKLTDAERIIEKQRKEIDILKGQNEGLEDALSLLTDSNNYVKTKLEEANKEVERLKHDTQADIRNKLSPMNTLCFMLDKCDPQDALGDSILSEIKEVKKSIEYLQDFLLKH